MVGGGPHRIETASQVLLIFLTHFLVYRLVLTKLNSILALINFHIHEVLTLIYHVGHIGIIILSLI